MASKDLNPIRQEIIVGKMARYDISSEEMAIRMHVSKETWRKLREDPSNLKLQQVELLKEILRFDMEELYRFITGNDFDAAFKTKVGRLGLKVLAG